ncbi:MAG: transcriptional regulator FeaR [Acidobacteriia bacterium]|nr:transcriptional regulator FeaR [Terriglobia bacterium]
MSQPFSTGQLSPSDRIDAWQWKARQICGDCRMHFPKNLLFHGSIDSRKIGGLEWTRFSSSAISFMKTPPETARSENRCCIVITQLRGVRRYSQDGAAVILQPGDSTLIDSGHPWSSDCPGECTRLYLRVPRWMMENRLRMSEIPVARRIPGKAGLGATLFHLTTSLYDEAELLKPEEGGAVLEGYFEILSACIGRLREDRGIGHEGTELCLRIQTFIEAHLAEPSLGPAEIASAAGISVRHLHRLFSLKGHTVGGWIRGRRLQQCRSDLADPRLRERSITEIAFLWGFSDSAHFSRSFRRQFGLCPRVFRTQAGLKTWNDERDQGVRDFLRTEIAELRCSKPN